MVCLSNWTILCIVVASVTCFAATHDLTTSESDNCSGVSASHAGREHATRDAEAEEQGFLQMQSDVDVHIEVEAVSSLLLQQGSSQAGDDQDLATVYMAALSVGLCSVFVVTLVAFIMVRTCYTVGAQSSESKVLMSPKTRLERGHCKCCDDPFMCVCAWICQPIRWSDTVSQSKVTSFWTAFGAWAIAAAFNCFMFGCMYFGVITLGLLIYFRQALRKKLGLEYGTPRTCIFDCFWMLFCTPCAVAQEALVVRDAVAVGDPIFVKSTEYKIDD